MSTIEKLKAEATALRETETKAGRVVKHCDALERVAKSHGYESWRACIASIDPATKEEVLTPKPAPSFAVTEKIRPSLLLGGEFESARQSAFTRWMSQELMQAAVDFSRNMGLLPLYAETSDLGTRYLFLHSPIGTLCEVRSARPKDVFLEFDRKNRAQGRRLVSLHVNSDEKYSAVWLSHEHYATAVQHLSRFGIAPAENREET
jgi:Glyoxalase superfamily protein